MWLLRGLLDRAVLVAGVVAGGVVPSYLAQYRQRVGGALGQAVQDLAPFQQIAERFHGGSLERLIVHHAASTDPTFRAEGAAIQAMVDSVASLQAALAALDTDVFRQLLHLLNAPDTAMLQATWSSFRPAFGLSADSLAMAAAFGVTVWLLFLAVWWVMASALVRTRLR
jgi:hypothetical protein